MSWKAGEKAYCIKKGSWSHAGTNGPKYGVIYLVDKVREADNGTWLDVSGFDPSLNCWDGSKFRKIVPQCDREEMTQEERITELIETKYPNLA